LTFFTLHYIIVASTVRLSSWRIRPSFEAQG